ncbi:MAG: beta strand repeat-containing protein [Isosphaeraceae bacterium]
MILKNLTRRRVPSRPNRDRHRLRPTLTMLEDRRLLSTFIVNNPTDTPVTGQTDLRQAIVQATTDTTNDTITFDSTVFNTPQTITLNSGQLDLTKANGTLSIQGPGANLLSVSGNNASRVFYLNGGSAYLAGLTVTGGYSANGGGLYNNGGTAMLNNCTVSGNSASNGGGGLDNNGGTATLTNCTVSYNSASNGGGGLDNNGGTATLTNCTVSGNFAGNGGGGLENNGGTATLTNCTVSGNSATNSGGGLENNGGAAMLTLTNCTVSGNTAGYYGNGGGLYNKGGTATLTNTIVAGNTAGTAGTGPDASGVFTSQGNNLIGETDGSSGWVGSDLTGTIAQPLNPLLAPLGNYGGPTQTMALLPGSPAIDAGDDAAAASLTTDQRGVGFPRILGSHVDIGAYEATPPDSFVVTTAADVVDANDGVTSLREAILAANADPNLTTITFAPSLDGTPIVLTAGGDLDVSTNVTIQGNGAANTIIDASGLGDRVLQVLPGGDLTLDGVTVTGGNESTGTGGGTGGGILNDGTLAVTNTTISGNMATYQGGGIFNNGTLVVTSSTFSGNGRNNSDGGGIANFGTLAVTSSTFSDNAGQEGGAIFNSQGQATVTNTTISGNTSDMNGGGIFNQSTLAVISSTIFGNTAVALVGGGGIFNVNTATVNNTIIAGSTAGDLISFGSLSGTNNLVQDGTGTGLVNTITGDPLLGPLQNNGGPTQTMALLPGSPAIDAGNNAAASGLTTDQRGTGFPRVLNMTVDIGAFESSPIALQPAFAGLNSATTTYGTPTVTFTGTLAADTTPATGNLTVTISGNGITALSQSASLDPNGNFSATFNTAALPANPSSPYTVTYDYAAQDNFLAATDASTTLTVNPATLTITANNDSKTYGTLATFSGTAFTETGLVTANGDSITGVTETSAGAPAPATVAGSPYSIVPSAAVGTGLSNYTIAYVNGNLTVNAAALTITANSTSKTYGTLTTFSGTAFTETGLVTANGDTITGVTETSTGAPASATVAGSPYSIVPSAAVGTGLSNYTIAYVNGNLTVNAAALTVTPTAESMTYGGTVPALTYTYTGLVNGDTSASFTGSLATTATSSSGVGSYAITQGTLAATGNYTIGTFNPAAPTVGDAGFETPPVGNGYQYNPTGTAWTFSGASPSGSGVAGNNSAFTSGNPNAPQGTQVAFLQETGTITQSVAGWSAGTYTISFYAAQRANYGSQNFEVLVDGSVVGTFTPTTTTYQPYSTSTFTVAAGPHTIKILGLDTAGGDHTVFLDEVSVASANVLTVKPATPTISWSNPSLITDLTPLTGTQLDATASWVVGGSAVTVGGTFAYTPAAGTLLAAGTQTLSTTFTPSDSTDYTTATATVQIVVLGPGVTVIGSQLYCVGGSSANDQVTINPAGSSNTGSTGVTVQTLLNGVNTTTTYSQSFTTVNIIGGGGNETVQMAPTLTINAVVTAGNGNDQATLGEGNNTVTLGNGNDKVQVQAGDGNNNVTVGNGNDTVTLGNGNNNVTVGNSNDTVTLGNGNNVVMAGTGNDTISAGTGTNTVTAGAVGSTGNIQVTLGNGANDNVTLLGNGNDNVTVGTGNNDIVSVSGNGNGNDNVTVGNGTVGNGTGDSVSIVGNGNEKVTTGTGTGTTGTGTGTVHIAGTSNKTLNLGKGWTQI